MHANPRKQLPGLLKNLHTFDDDEADDDKTGDENTEILRLFMIGTDGM